MPAKGWRKKVCQKCGYAFWCAPEAPVVCMDCQVAPFFKFFFLLFALFLLFLGYLAVSHTYTLTGFSIILFGLFILGILGIVEGINKQREIGRETEWTSVKISKNLYERGNFSRIPTSSQKEVASQIGSLSEIEYRKIRFDTKLRQMLEEALSKQGQKFCTIVSKHLHDRVVFSWQTNRIPMACSAMWKLWEEQGSHKDRIIYTTPSGQSSTITIVFATGSTKEDHAEKLPLKYTQEIDSKLQQILREARNKKEKFRKITPQRWHNRDVATLMPLACKVMWQLWEEQGSHEERIIDTTPRSLSPTISVEFDTGLMEKNKKTNTN